MRNTERDDGNADERTAEMARSLGRARSRADAAEAMIAMDLPVAEWGVMKAEILAGAGAGASKVETRADRPDR